MVNIRVTVERGPCALAVTVRVAVTVPDVAVAVTVLVTVVDPVAICEQAYEILDAGQSETSDGVAARLTTPSYLASVGAVALRLLAGPATNMPCSSCHLFTSGTEVCAAIAFRFTRSARKEALLVAVTQTVLEAAVAVYQKSIVEVG